MAELKADLLRQNSNDSPSQPSLSRKDSNASNASNASNESDDKKSKESANGASIGTVVRRTKKIQRQTLKEFTKVKLTNY